MALEAGDLLSMARPFADAPQEKLWSRAGPGIA